MRISKTLRQVIYALVPHVVAGLLIRLTFESVGWPSLFFLLLALPPVSIVLTLPIDSLDLWLRRRTRDPIWLLTAEGRAWLASAEGRDWRAAKGECDVALRRGKLTSRCSRRAAGTRGAGAVAWEAPLAVERQGVGRAGAAARRPLLRHSFLASPSLSTLERQSQL